MNLGDSVRDRDQLCCLLTATAPHGLFQKNPTENASCPCDLRTLYVTKLQLCCEFASESPVEPTSCSACQLRLFRPAPDLPASAKPVETNRPRTGAVAPETQPPSRPPLAEMPAKTKRTRASPRFPGCAKGSQRSTSGLNFAKSDAKSKHKCCPRPPPSAWDPEFTALPDQS